VPGELLISANTESLGLSVSICSDARAASGDGQSCGVPLPMAAWRDTREPLYGIFLVPSWCQTTLGLPDQRDRSSCLIRWFCCGCIRIGRAGLIWSLFVISRSSVQSRPPAPFISAIPTSCAIDTISVLDLVPTLVPSFPDNVIKSLARNVERHARCL